jgi:hydrogenase nickel incorporation protein HypA/HybF
MRSLGKAGRILSNDRSHWTREIVWSIFGVMHELGIMESALDAIRHQAVKHGAARVSRIVLRIGTLAGVDQESLRFAYEALAPTSIAAGAVLEIETVTARARCAACQTEFGVERGFVFQCPQCGEYSGDIRAGRELGIARLEFPDL